MTTSCKTRSLGISPLRTTHAGGHPRRSEEGFSLIELLVALTIAVFVLLAVFVAVDVSSEVSRVEIQKADLQQALRGAQRTVARSIRMAGRGGLPPATVGDPVFRSPALAVANRAAASQAIAPGFSGSPEVREDTDVLTLRGVFNAPIYQVNSTDSTTLTLEPDDSDPTTAERGLVVINDPGPAGTEQSLIPLCEAINAARPEALILTSPLGPEVYGVVQLDPPRSTAPSDCSTATQLQVAFLVTGGTHTAAYRGLFATPLAAGLPATLRAVASVGLLEEFRYYVREADPPAFSRAQFFPNMDTPWGTDPAEQLANLSNDIADGILDFQVSLGFDSPEGGFFDQDNDNDGDDDRILETDDGENDDWLFNSENDDATMAPWSPPWDAATPRPNLYFVRVNFLARTLRSDRGYVAPALAAIEDRDYSEPALPDTPASRTERMFRRGLITTLVEMRNL